MHQNVIRHQNITSFKCPAFIDSIMFSFEMHLNFPAWYAFPTDWKWGGRKKKKTPPQIILKHKFEVGPAKWRRLNWINIKKRGTHKMGRFMTYYRTCGPPDSISECIPLIGWKVLITLLSFSVERHKVIEHAASGNSFWVMHCICYGAFSIQNKCILKLVRAATVAGRESAPWHRIHLTFYGARHKQYRLLENFYLFFTP